MKRDRAAYMREYRARPRVEREPVVVLNGDTYAHLQGRITELEAEVAQLKRELASRPAPALGTFNSRPFRPVPKIRPK